MDGEGDADGAQLVHRLLLEGGDVCATGTDHGLAVVLAVAHPLTHQLGVVLAAGVVADALHGVEVVLALQGIDGVGAGVVGGQVQTLQHAAAESLVGHGLVPVVVGGAVVIEALKVEVELVAVLLGALFAQLVGVLVVGIVGDGGDGRLGQVDLVQLAVLVQLVAHNLVGQHGDDDALKAAVVVGAVQLGLGMKLLVLRLTYSSIRYGPQYHISSWVA